MDFVTQFENTLEQTIRQEMYAEAEQLLAAYPATGQPYTLKLFSLINRLRQSSPPDFRRIVLFRTGNFILDYILRQFQITLSGHGCEAFVFDPEDYAGSTDAFFLFARGGMDAAYFFNNVGLLQTLADGRNLWETLEVPCFDFLVDHPMYYADSLDHAPAQTTVLCADRTHTDYVRRFYPRVHAARFLPTGGCEVSADTKNAAGETGADWAKREIDVLFIGSYKYNTAQAEDDLARCITEHLIAHPGHTFEQAIELCLKEGGGENGAGNESFETEPFTDVRLKEIIEKYRFTETNLTSLYRKTLMEEIVNAGIDIHVYGNGWEQTSLPQHPCFHLHAPVSFEEGLTLMAQSKIVLNHMAWFKHGSSERIFNAMAQGAVCITDSSAYLDDILKDEVNCRLYTLPEILPAGSAGAGAHSEATRHAIAERIAELLSDPDTASAIAAEGQKTASQHTWRKHLLYDIINT